MCFAAILVVQENAHIESLPRRNICVDIILAFVLFFISCQERTSSIILYIPMCDVTIYMYEHMKTPKGNLRVLTLRIMCVSCRICVCLFLPFLLTLSLSLSFSTLKLLEPDQNLTYFIPLVPLLKSHLFCLPAVVESLQNLPDRIFTPRRAKEVGRKEKSLRTLAPPSHRSKCILASHPFIRSYESPIKHHFLTLLLVLLFPFTILRILGDPFTPEQDNLTNFACQHFSRSRDMGEKFFNLHIYIPSTYCS